MFEECQPQSLCLPDKARFRTISSNSCIDSRPSRFESMARNSSAHLKSGDRALELKAEKVPFDERLSMNRHLYWWFWDSSFSNAPFFVHLSKLVRTSSSFASYIDHFFSDVPPSFFKLSEVLGNFSSYCLIIYIIYICLSTKIKAFRARKLSNFLCRDTWRYPSKSGGKSPTKRWTWCPFQMIHIKWI